MMFSVLLSTTLLVCSASATASSSSSSSSSSASESRGYSSHAAAAPAATYESREVDSLYSKSPRASYESGEDASAVPEDYAHKSPAKKTVILAIPVKLALQQASEHKPAAAYEAASGESYGSGARNAYPASYTSYADQSGSRAEAGNGNAGYSSSSGPSHSGQYEYSQPKHQSSQLTYHPHTTPAYTASATQGHSQAAPAILHTRDHGDRYMRTYSDKSPPPKPYNPDNDVEISSHSAYASASPYENSPKLSRQPYSYSQPDESAYEVEEVPQPRPRKTYKRPAAYLEESAEEESYSPPTSSASLRQQSSKYLTLDSESDAYPGLDGSSGYATELAEAGKNSGSNLQSYGAEGLEDADYSSLSGLGLQSYNSPSLPQSELSYLMSKMPRGGFSHVPASSSYGLELGSGSRLGSYNQHPYGLPSRAGRRPYGPSPYPHSSPYLKSPYPSPSYPGPKMYMPAASYKSYATAPYYGAASSPVPASSPFRLSGAMTGLGKSFGSGKGLRIGPLEFGSSGSIFPTIKIKSPVRV